MMMPGNPGAQAGDISSPDMAKSLKEWFAKTGMQNNDVSGIDPELAQLFSMLLGQDQQTGM